jgi:hypothetical protein
MITKEQATDYSITEFFTFSTAGVNTRQNPDGVKVYRWRRNGSAKVWVTRPNDWEMPLKYGLRGYWRPTNFDAAELFASEAEAREAGLRRIAERAGAPCR